MKRSCVVFLVLVFLFALHSGAQASMRIVITAEGSHQVSPDMAYVILGVQTKQANAHKALETANKTMEDIKSVVSRYTEEKEIRTTDFSLYATEKWDDTEKEFVPDGFSVRHMISFPIYDLKTLSLVLDQSVAKGANMVQDITFDVRDRTAAREQAYRNAIAEAWWKARIVAESNNMQTIEVVHVIESSAYVRPSLDYMRADSFSYDPFSPGQLKVQVHLSVEFNAY